MNQNPDPMNQDKQKPSCDSPGQVLRLLAMMALTIILVWGTIIIIERFSPSDSDSPLRMLLPLLMIVPLGVGVLAVMFLLIRRDFSELVQKRKHEMEILRQAVPDLVNVQQPRETPKTTDRKKKSCLFWILAIIILYAANTGIQTLIERYWPTVSGALKEMVPFALAITAIIVWEGLVEVIRKAREEKIPIPWRKLGRRAAAILLLIILFAGLLFVYDSMLSWVFSSFGNRLSINSLAGITVTILAGLLLAVLLGTALVLPFVTLPQVWVSRPLHRLDYDKALARATRIERFLNSTTMKGIVLLHTGRYEEAEAAFRHSITNSHKSLMGLDFARGWLLENFGYALTEQAQYEEAAKALEGARKLAPNDSDRSNGLAEVYLRQGIKPQQALALTEHSIRSKKKIANQFLARYTTAELLGNRAWALALAGQHQEAWAILDQALKRARHRSKLSKVSVYYRAGHTMWLCQDEQAARAYFEQAVEMDPQGHYGLLASRSLSEFV
jgi:tetratricopeptide (TPR) repeat protein